jgi:tetratricopeptide (TPR) repeat protein
VTALQWMAILAIGLPALVIVMWPLMRGGGRFTMPSRGFDDRLELEEDKASIYQALAELEFDHETGSLSDDDYRSLRDRYEGRAAEVIARLDAMGSVIMPPPPAPEPASVGPAPWTRRPATLTVGGLAMLVLGVGLGVGVSRYTTPADTMIPPESRVPVPTTPDPGPLLQGKSGTPMKPIPPEMLAGMLRAARQSLMEGRYQEAIAAYQAVLKRDEKNVDAMTHLALIVAMGGHADAALETFDKALKIDPDYAPAFLYRGQLLYEVKRDYAGAIKAWQRFVALAPPGEDRDRVTALIDEAKRDAQRGAKQKPPAK